MKKTIACLLTLCLLLSTATVDWGSMGVGAIAESAEAAAPIATQSVEPAQTDAGSETADLTDTSEKTTAETTEQTAGDAAAEQTEAAVTEEATATPEATASPDVTTSTEATATPTPVVTDAPVAEVAAEETPAVEEDTGSGPAWILQSNHRHFGHLEDLLPIVMVSGQTIYLCTTGVITLTGSSVADIANVTFGVDEDTLSADFYGGKSVVISAISPDGKTADNTLYIWIGYKSDIPTPADVLGESVQINSDEADQLEVEIKVEAADYTGEDLCTPTFTLTAYPELSEGMSFAVILNGGDAQPIDGNTFAPVTSGVYRFAVLDAAGALKGKSIEYNVLYGAPEATVAATDATGAEATPEPTVEATAEPTETPLTEADVLQAVELAQTETSTEEEAPEISVRAYDYVENTLSDVTPTFELSGAPAEGGYYYGVAINGGNAVRLLSNTYAVTKSGDYTLAFYLINGSDKAVSASAIYHVIVDYTEASQNNEAWMTVGKVKRYGSLASLLREADSGATIYLLTSGVIALSDVTKLNSVKLAADPSTYGAEYGVVTSSNSPDGESTEGVTYVWLGVDVSDVSAAVENAAKASTITINAVNIGDRVMQDGLWVNGSDAVTFNLTDTLTGNAYNYQVAVDGGALQTFSNGGVLSGLSLVEGKTYVLTFYVTDADLAGNEAAVSYTVSYDSVAPILICKAGTNNTLSFYAGDSISGFYTSGTENNVSFAGGASATWTALLEYYVQNVYTYSVQYASSGIIPAGTLAVRDKANNKTVWGQDVTISSGTNSNNTATTGSSGSSSSASRTVSHSASTYTTVTAYNGVELVVETGAMKTLTIGDQVLDLALTLDGGTQPAEGYEPTFTASFTDWKGGGGAETTDAVDDDVAVDTLVLTATQEATAAEGNAYSWTFDGSVYKKLAASGIDYLVLTVGDNVTALSTAGFAAGIRYNMYRAAGLASKAFVYTIRMNANADGTADTDSLQVQVAVNGETYTLSGDQTSEFYYYDLYNGTKDMLSKPFGQGASTEGLQG